MRQNVATIENTLLGCQTCEPSKWSGTGQQDHHIKYIFYMKISKPTMAVDYNTSPFWGFGRLVRFSNTLYTGIHC